MYSGLIAEANVFYENIAPKTATADEKLVQRRALAGLLWTKQSYIFDVARWPVHVFRGVWRAFLTFVIPVAVMTTFPAMALLGRLDTRTALGTIGGALLLLVISRLVWRAAIRSYTSASS